VVDKIKQCAVASRRCFVVEVMGRYCGYLALMSGLASGAERVYLHEEGVTLHDLQNRSHRNDARFRLGKRLSLVIRNEQANPLYTTDFMVALFEEEGKDLFDVRPAILGHLQQGGDPSPFDRIQATRLARRCVEFLSEQGENGATDSALMGLQGGHIKVINLEDMPRLADSVHSRPREHGGWICAQSPGCYLSPARSRSSTRHRSYIITAHNEQSRSINMSRIAIHGFWSHRTIVDEGALNQQLFTPISISDIKDAPTLAALFEVDSNYGRWHEEVKTNDKGFVIGGRAIPFSIP